MKLRHQSALDVAGCGEAHPDSIAFWAVLEAYHPAVSPLVVALMVTLGHRAAGSIDMSSATGGVV